MKLFKISATFLAALLVAGTIALSSPSFMLGAQADLYYGIDKRYDNYGSDYDSYGKDSYDKRPYGNDDYGKDSYDKKPYGNSYGQDYPSYKPEYKKDPYGKDRDNDKSKDNISVSINKIKCINTNININGNNAGNISLGNKGKEVGAEEGGYVGAYSSGSDGEGYNDGYDKKKDKGFECIINNNNNNTNIITGGGNQTIPPDDGDEKTTLNVIKTVKCEPAGNELCTRLLTDIGSGNFTMHVSGNGPTPADFKGAPDPGTPVDIGAGPYNVTETIPNNAEFPFLINFALFTTGARDCPADNAFPKGTITAGVDQTCEIINTYRVNVAGSTGASSFITAQGTADSSELTAMEKITKLKTQWLNQLP
jgi:hypothetical protein